VFAGYGISAKDLKYDDYGDLPVKGKVLLIIRREPQQDDADSPFQGKKTTTHAFVRNKLQLAKRRGAAAVLFVNDPFSTKQANKDELAKPAAFGSASLGIPFLQVTQAAAEKMLAVTPLKSSDQKDLKTIAAVESEIDESFAPLSQSLGGWTAELKCEFQSVKAEVVNVIGVLEGEGPLADETIVLGAHYDHIGYGEFGSRRPSPRAIHNGADDNASGTAAILEVARRLATRPAPPSRRLVFIAFSAEERGLVGSRYYLDHPSFPLSKTVAMLNFDMIGSLRNRELTVGGIGSGAQFAALLDRVSGEYDLKIKQINRVLRTSDHFLFFERNIPVLFFWTGLTEDYHTPDDDFEKINVEGVVTTVDFAESLLDGLLQMGDRPELVKVGPKPENRGGMPYLGITPDYANSAGILKISAVAPNSPAAKATLKPKDVILRYEEFPITDLASLMTGLRRNKPGDKVKIAVKRGEEELIVAVTLGKPPSN
jgi:hypothetical protein